MNEEYPELDSVDYCRKCGVNIDPEGADSTPATYSYGCNSRTDAAGNYVILQEWITRTCKCCSYKWREAVLEPGL